MNLSRRNVLRMAAVMAALPFAARLARGEAYPSRPVHLPVGPQIMAPIMPADAAKFVAADTAKWVKVVKFANVKVD